MCKIRSAQGKSKSPKHLYFDNATSPETATAPPVDFAIHPETGMIQQVTFFIMGRCNHTRPKGIPDSSHKGILRITDEQFIKKYDVSLFGVYQTFFSEQDIYLMSLSSVKGKIESYQLGLNNCIYIDECGSFIGLSLKDITQNEQELLIQAEVV